MTYRDTVSFNGQHTGNKDVH